VRTVVKAACASVVIADSCCVTESTICWLIVAARSRLIRSAVRHQMRCTPIVLTAMAPSTRPAIVMRMPIFMATP
jgi:hypothetical protein